MNRKKTTLLTLADVKMIKQTVMEDKKHPTSSEEFVVRLLKRLNRNKRKTIQKRVKYGIHRDQS